LYPYAATCALVALVKNDAEVRIFAAAELKRVLPAGSQTTAIVNTLLKALEESDFSRIRAFMTTFRDALRGNRRDSAI
jgi:hypothetical protein